MGIVDTNNPAFVIPEELDDKSLNGYFDKFVDLADKEMSKEKNQMPKIVDEKKKFTALEGPMLRMYTILGLNPSDEEAPIILSDYIQKTTNHYLKEQEAIEKRVQEKKE
jgi:hypothetical protein